LIVLLLSCLIHCPKALAQSSWTTTKNSVSYICLRSTLVDTIIHDLKERKLMLKKDSLLIINNSILRSENSMVNIKTNQLQKSLNIEQFKRQRNGWQRNVFIITTIIATYLCIK
jgi:hypothetical protein